MAEIRRIVRGNPLSRQQQVGPEGGGGFALIADLANQAYDFMEPAAIDQMKRRGDKDAREYAKMQAGNNRVKFSFPGVDGGAGTGTRLRALIDKTEGAGSFSTLFGHAQKPGGRFAGVDVSKMTLDELAAFTAPDGEYGQWVKSQVGRVATPAGAGQIVGTTARRTAKQLGLSGDTLFDANTQNIMINHLARQAITGPLTMTGKIARLRGEWEGLKNVDDADLEAAISEFEGGGGAVAPEMQDVQPTLVTTSEGATEPRLFSPMSGPILQAYNAAASTAYLSEMTLSSEADLSGLSSQYPLDPDGFAEATRGYIEEAVKAAPEQFRPDIRANLERSAQQRYLGMMEDKHADIRKRADNSSRALIDRWGTEYAEAIASGNTEAAVAARERLGGLLTAREAIPGLSWTRAQSENAVLDAERSAQALISKRRTEYVKGVVDRLDSIISIGKNGQSSADEGILNDPNTFAIAPEKAMEAAAVLGVRDSVPEIFAMPPAARKAVIAEEQGRMLGEAWETYRLDAMKSVDTAANSALAKDPMQYFQDYMPANEKPPALPDMTDAGNYMAALTARRDYARARVEEGYLAQPVYFSDAEVKTMIPVFAEGADPTVKAIAAQAFVTAFGPATSKALKEVKADKVTQQVGGLMAAGVSEAVGQKALIGQQMLSEGLVILPPKASSIEVLNPDIAAAISAGPAVQGQVMAAAKAIYAASARGIDPQSDDALNLMESALQEALGFEEGTRGGTGGVQEVNGFQTLLPPGIKPDQVEVGIRNALGFTQQTGRGGEMRVTEPQADLWGGNGVPSYNGEPLTARQMRDARFIPVTSSSGQIMHGFYRMEVFGGTDVENEDGNVFIFDMRKLAQGGD